MTTPQVSAPPTRVGLREAHSHLAALGESLSIPSLASCANVEECLGRVRADAARLRPGEWLRFLGARVESWREARWPTLPELDAAAGNLPCVIKSFDHHAGVANTAAMIAAGLRPGMRVPPNGEVIADAAGTPTGLLVEQAAWAAWQAAPPPTTDQQIGSVRAAIGHLRRFGFVEAHDMFSQEWLGPALARLEADADLDMRVWLYAPLESAGAFAARDWESERVRFAGLKVFADGTLNSRTALMLMPYADTPPAHAAAPEKWRGKAMMTEPQLAAAIGVARSMGAGLAVHAIGDAAVRMALDVWEESGQHSRLAANGTPALRIEHAEIIDEADIPRFARLGVTCSVQPCHLLYDAEVLQRALPHRLDRVLPLRDLIDAGCAPGELLWFGSDTPIVPADPMDSINAALKRRRENMPEHDAIAPGQRITAPEAWRAFCAPGPS